MGGDLENELYATNNEKTHTMTIDRNPDVDLDVEKVPAGLVLIEGKHLMTTARAAKIPFGLGLKIRPCSNSTRKETVGIIIRKHHKAAMLAALEKKKDSYWGKKSAGKEK